MLLLLFLYLHVSQDLFIAKDQPKFHLVFFHVQSSPFIKLCLGSKEMDRVINELCYIGIILQSNYGK